MRSFLLGALCVLLGIGLIWWSLQDVARKASEATDSDDEPAGEICAQVITSASNPATGEVRDFPTPCDVPEGWEACGEETCGVQ